MCEFTAGCKERWSGKPVKEGTRCKFVEGLRQRLVISVSCKMQEAFTLVTASIESRMQPKAIWYKLNKSPNTYRFYILLHNVVVLDLIFKDCQ